MSAEYFDLSALLEISELDIRAAASTVPPLSVVEYFGLLSQFLSFAPSVENALSKFAGLEEDRNAYRYLESAISLLEKLGCDRFSKNFLSILDAYAKIGDWELSAARAKKIMGHFSEFHARIMAAHKMEKSEGGPEDKNAASPGEALSLKEFLKNIDDEEAARKKKEAPKEEEAGGKMVILAVDDSPDILKAVFSLLRDTYKVVPLTDPTKLESALKQVRPALFLLDYIMPVLSGVDLIPIIRSFEEHKDTPIVFLTSESSIDNVSAAIALGACDFILKPFAADKLREKIAKHIVKKN